MKTNPLKQGSIVENSTGIGTVTSEMVRDRAAELALIDGRSAKEVSKSDLNQARLELTGDSDADTNEEILESAPESERWEPVHGSTGRKVSEAPSDDEDDEGRSDSARLVEEGVAEAEHDQMLQAAKAQMEKDE
jgi:hypothetical protein